MGNTIHELSSRAQRGICIFAANYRSLAALGMTKSGELRVKLRVLTFTTGCLALAYFLGNQKNFLEAQWL